MFPIKLGVNLLKQKFFSDGYYSSQRRSKKSISTGGLVLVGIDSLEFEEDISIKFFF